MTIIKCKMCGGDLNWIEGASTAECEFCGSVQTVPKVDDEKKLIQFERAERLRKQCEFDKAAGIYESIVSDFRQEAEAYWGLVLCKYGIEYVDDPTTGKKIPTCHRSSFDSIMEDSDFEQALENADGAARRVYREEAKQIEEIRRGIISVSSNEPPYDIFICYKETDEKGDRTLDSVLAQDVYDALTGKGYRVFFARITLEDKLGQEYEPYIFAALNSAKVMLAFGTDYEYFNAVWVKNEWSRFLKLMAKDKGKHLIPCFKGIDAYDMPKEFARLQAQDLGKVGATQDLLRGIDKLLPKQSAAPAPQTQTVAAVATNPTVASYLKRAFLFLEDSDWSSANDYCEKVLDIDPENGRAYLGKLLAELKLSQPQMLGSCDQSFEQSGNYLKIMRFGDDALRDTMKQCLAQLQKRQAQAEAQRQQEEAKRQKAEAEKHFEQFTEVKDGKLVKYHGTAAVLIIPNIITSIGEFAFSECTSLTEVTIPNSVTSIDSHAFYKCTALTHITIPDSVTNITGNPFRSCTALTAITVADTNLHYTSDDEGRLFSKDKKTLICVPAGSCNPCQIPDHVSCVGEYALSGCINLTKITIPDSVTRINRYAFCECTGLTGIAIPDSVTEIENNPFLACSALKAITVAAANRHYWSDDLGVVYSKDKESLLCVPAGLRGHYYIPDHVKEIGNDALRNCTGLTGLTIPNTITAIDAFEFEKCTGLINVTIPNSVTSIGMFAFSGCTALTGITIPHSVTLIEYEVFSGCTALTDITIPDSVTKIESYAFKECTGLTSILIPGSVTEIGRKIFGDCDTTRITVYTSPGSFGENWAKKNGLTVAEDPQHRRSRQELSHRLAYGLCVHCGGQFKGVFSKKCSQCGKPKNY